jgi:hypothetical protein
MAIAVVFIFAFAAFLTHQATKKGKSQKTKKIKRKSRAKSSETAATEEEIHNDMLEISDGGIDIIANGSITNASDMLDDESKDTN